VNTSLASADIRVSEKYFGLIIRGRRRPADSGWTPLIFRLYG